MIGTAPNMCPPTWATAPDKFIPHEVHAQHTQSCRRLIPRPLFFVCAQSPPRRGTAEKYNRRQAVDKHRKQLRRTVRLLRWRPTHMTHMAQNGACSGSPAQHCRAAPPAPTRGLPTKLLPHGKSTLATHSQPIWGPANDCPSPHHIDPDHFAIFFAHVTPAEPARLPT